jgi:hypothetical protein
MTRKQSLQILQWKINLLLSEDILKTLKQVTGKSGRTISSMKKRRKGD